MGGKQEAHVWNVSNGLGLEAAQSFLHPFHSVLGLTVTPKYTGRWGIWSHCVPRKKKKWVWWAADQSSPLSTSTRGPLGVLGGVTVGKFLPQGLLLWWLLLVIQECTGKGKATPKVVSPTIQFRVISACLLGRELVLEELPSSLLLWVETQTLSSQLPQHLLKRSNYPMFIWKQ